jgi:serine/threonine protein phosphatase PrpC
MSLSFYNHSFILKGQTSPNGCSYSEDRCCIFVHENITFNFVLDGHGGDICVNKIYESLNDVIFRTFFSLDLSDIQQIINANRQIYIELVELTKDYESGCCMAMIIILPDNTMIASHLGDCKIYVFNHNIMYISQDHDPLSDMAEVRKRGGRVSLINGPRLVSSFGNLGVARAFGDKNIKGVGKDPEIQIIGSNWNQFILTSDCLTDSLTRMKISTEQIIDEEGYPVEVPLHEKQKEAEPAVTEEIIKIFSLAIKSTETKYEAIEECMSELVKVAEKFPDNYSIICGSKN